LGWGRFTRSKPAQDPDVREGVGYLLRAEVEVRVAGADEHRDECSARVTDGLDEGMAVGLVWW